MAAQENQGTETSQQGQQGGYNPNIGQDSQDKYNPKREANQQSRDESTGLSEEEDMDLEESESDIGSVDDDDSGAV